MKSLGGLTLVWVIVKIVQWNISARWHFDVAVFVSVVLVLYFEPDRPVQAIKPNTIPAMTGPQNLPGVSLRAEPCAYFQSR